MRTMEKLKRMLALLLCVTMLTGPMLPAYADEGGHDHEIETTGEGGDGDQPTTPPDNNTTPPTDNNTTPPPDNNTTPPGDNTTTTPPGDDTTTPPPGDNTTTPPPGDNTTTTPPGDNTTPDNKNDNNNNNNPPKEEECKHENRDNKYLTYRPEGDGWKDKYDGTHTAHCKVVLTYECKDCGKTLNETVREGRETLKHEFSGGVCKQCHAVQPQCGHESRIALDNAVERSSQWTDDKNGKTHSASFAVTPRTKCEDCGKEFSGETETKSRSEAHAYVSGTCSVCGALCTHADMLLAETKKGEPGAYSDLGDGTHGAAQTVTLVYVCPDCGALENRAGEDETVTAPHAYGEDGLCTVCKAACPHENATSETVDRETSEWIATYEWSGEHFCEVLKVKVHTCPDCGKSWDGESWTEDVYEEHTLDADGVCTLCGAKKPCMHANGSSIGSEPVEWGDWTPTGEGSEHYREVVIWEIMSCPDCGALYPGEETIEDEYGVHEYGEDGLCTVCGAEEPKPCAHEYDDDGLCTLCREADPSLLGGLGWGTFAMCLHRGAKETGNKRYVAVDGSYVPAKEGHTGKFTEFIEMHCDLCGRTWEEEAEDEKEFSAVTPHTLKDGVCTVCGYEPEDCAANGHVKGTVVKTEKKPDPGSTWTVNERDKTHSNTFYTFTTYKCQTCGFEFTEKSAKGEKITQPHTFEAGVCVCGALDDCQHADNSKLTESSRVVTTRPTSWTDDHDGRHHSGTAIVTVTYVCGLCGGTKTVTEDEIITEAHTFEGDDLAQGAGESVKRCTAPGCGATSCTHESVTKTVSYVTEGGAASFNWVHNGNSAEHTSEVKVKTVTHHKCEECKDEWDVTGEAESITQPHNFNAAGECEACGYTKAAAAPACEHKTTRTVKTYTYPTEAKDYTNNTKTDNHTVKVKVKVATYCALCDAPIGTPADAADETVTVAHVYDQTGKCICGAEKNKCQHLNKEVTPRLDPATGYDWEDAGDGVHHRRLCKVINVTTCPDCNDYPEPEKDTLKTAYEYAEHTYDEYGVCTAGKCKYERKCTHGRTTTFLSYADEAPDAAPLSWTDEGLTHSAQRTEIITVKCMDCGMALSSTAGETKRVYEPHTYQNGKCVLCLAEKACDHRYKNVERVTAYVGIPTTVTATTHKGLAYVQEMTTCADCGEELGVRTLESNVEKTEAHSFENGKCVVCGYTVKCDHAKTVTGKVKKLISATPFDDKQHTMLADEVEITVCTLCGQELKSKTVTPGMSFKENHTFDRNGLCTACNYYDLSKAAVSSCQHEKTAVRYRYVQQSDVSQKDNTNHAYTAREIKEVYCTDAKCGKLVYSQETGVVTTRTEAHIYNGSGVCIKCGHKYVAPAQPEPEKPKKKKKKKSSSSSSSSSSYDEQYTTDYLSSLAESVWAPAVYAANDVLTVKLARLAESAMLADANAGFKILGAQEIVPADIYERMQLLPADEQVLVVLAAAGHITEVERAMNSFAVEYSTDAYLLAKAAADALAKMTATERAAHDLIVAKYFPKGYTAINAVIFDYMTVDVQTVSGGLTRVDRYGFCYDSVNDQWFYVKSQRLSETTVTLK